MHTRLLKLARQSEKPVCLQCLQPHDPYVHRCPHCGAPVGQFMPNMPLESVAFEADFWGKLWKRIWSDETAWPWRIACLVLITCMVPIMLVGLPFVFSKTPRDGAVDSMPPHEPPS